MRVRISLLLACVATAPACAGLRAPAAGETAALWSAAGACDYDGASGESVAEGALVAEAAASRAVHAGERHDSAAHHRAQLELLRSIEALKPGRVAAGFEMLHYTQQASLDRYLSGAADEAAFLAEVDWKKTWGFPFELYRPLFQFLRERGLRGVALNAPRGLVRKVAMKGLEGLSAEDRAQLPRDVRLAEDPAYRAMLVETFKGHGGDPSDEAALLRYLQAMAVWNETMAEKTADAMRAAPETTFVVIAGAFHAYDAGIPSGIARRVEGAAQTSVILAESASCPQSLPAEDRALRADFHRLVRP